MNHRRLIAPLAILLVHGATLAAQGRPASTPAAAAAATAAARRAAETITEADLRRIVGVLADDSMLGRATPSPQIEQTATYLAAEFRRLGLRPAGDSGSFIQRYPIIRSQLDSSSFVMVMGRGAHGHWTFGRDAVLLRGAEPVAPVNGPIVLMSGVPADTVNPFGSISLRGAVVLHISALAPLSSPAFAAVFRRAAAGGAVAWIVASPTSATQFANAARRALQPSTQLGGGAPEAASLPVLHVRDSSALGVLTAAGENLMALRASAGAVRPLEGFTGALDLRRTVLETQTAPNVIGVVEGSDPALRTEYIFFTSHMDHVGAVGPGRANVGCRASGADSICNGADDDASGTATVLELAEAFSRLNPRPRRSMVFMAVSGEERGLWGSEYYSEHPTLPLAATVAAFNLDMVGRYYNNQPGWTDTIVAIGKEHSDLGAAANRVVAAHPELRMNLIDDLWPQESFYFRSDHYNLARTGVPILFFFNGVHPDYHRASDSPDKIDAEKMARIGRMVFYLGLDVANAVQRPQWNPESRARIVQPPR